MSTVARLYVDLFKPEVRAASWRGGGRGLRGATVALCGSVTYVCLCVCVLCVGVWVCMQVVLVSDDNALKYFVVPYLRDNAATYNASNATSFVFTGINVDPVKDYSDVIPSDVAGNRSAPVCGTLERAPVPAIVNTMTNIKPSFKHLALLTDSGEAQAQR